MLKELIGLFVRAQTGTLKRKATGAIVEAAALGLFGFATFFALLGVFLWLSTMVEYWLAALIVAAIVLVIAIILMLIGRLIMQRKTNREKEQLDRALREIAPFAQMLTGDDEHPGLSEKSSAGLVAAALAAGVVLGRSLRR